MLANVLWFARRGVLSYFAIDDMMNMGGYWATPTWKLVGAQFAFFSSYYRPMGALFYLPLFHLFGFNPLPDPAPPAGIEAGGLIGPEGLCFDSNGNLYVGSTTGHMASLARDFGLMIGVRYGEPFVTREVAEVEDIVNLPVKSI